MTKIYKLWSRQPFLLDDQIWYFRKMDGMYAQVVHDIKDINDVESWQFAGCGTDVEPLTLLASDGIYR